MTKQMQIVTAIVAFAVAAIFIFDPVGELGFRNFAFAICTLIGFPLLFRENIDFFSALFVIIFIILMPIWGFILYLINSSPPLYDTSYISFSLLMGFAGLFVRDKDQFIAKSTVLSSSFIVSALIIYIFINVYIGNINSLSFFTQNSIAVISQRDYGQLLLPYIFVISSPLLILGCCKIIFDRNSSKTFAFLSFSLFIFCLFISGTRAHQFIAVILMVMFIFSRFRKNIGLLITVPLIGGLIYEFLPTLRSMFDGTDVNNLYKIVMFDVYFDIFNDFGTVIFGQGFNASTWSYDLQKIVSLEIGATKTELTYLEILRVFGFPFGAVILVALFLFILGRPERRAELAWLRVGIIIQLLNASLNAYLFSFNGAFGLAILLGLSWQKPSAYVVFRSSKRTPYGSEVTQLSSSRN